MQNNELKKKFDLEMVRVIVSMTYLNWKISILIDKKLHENFLIYNISYKNLIGQKHLHSRFDEIGGFIIIYDGTLIFTLMIFNIVLT